MLYLPLHLADTLQAMSRKSQTQVKRESMRNAKSLDLQAALNSPAVLM